MNSAMVLVAVLSMTGCVMVPVTTNTETVVGRRVNRTEPGRPGHILLSASVDAGVVTIVSRRERDCAEHITTTVEYRRETKAEVKGGDVDLGADPRVWIVLAPIMGGVFGFTAVITGVVVLATPDKAERRDYSGQRFVACPIMAPQIPIHATWPSGALLDAVTDANGNATLVVPDTEPAVGVLRVRAYQRKFKVAYRRPQRSRPSTELRPPGMQKPFVDADAELPPGIPSATKATQPAAVDGFLAAQKATLSCGRQLAMSGIARIRISVSSEGRATEVRTDIGGEPFNTCVGQALASVQFTETQRGTVEIPFQLR